MEPLIKSIKAIEVLDSRGNPTLKVTCVLQSGESGSAFVPSGASTGTFEALELRDGDKKRFKGKGVLKAKKIVEEIIAPCIKEMNCLRQREIDYKMIELDGTENKTELGANAILGVSLSVARAAAHFLKVPLYRYLGGLNSFLLPLPMINIVNGGAHADNPIDIQEFMIVPSGFSVYSSALQASSEVFHTLKEILKEKGLSTSVGDEGGFAPSIEKTETVIELILKSIEKAGYNPEENFHIALDCAASQFYNKEKKVYKLEGNELKGKELVYFYKELIKKYPICSIEDGADEDDWETWKILTEEIGEKILLVGDDIFVTNKKRIQKGIEEKVANAVLVKLNQIGTVTETIESIDFSRENGYRVIISHRSGETEDSFIADFSVAMETGFIKTGAPSRGERTSKYNRLLEIEKEIDFPVYSGKKFLK